ncbi:hypothetical protein LX36DRAFT_651745 [Colletotrichum falcatum]|nr:hypothetical protein LX36DRAFT_651745 [Colletotrichum falcatum]
MARHFGSRRNELKLHQDQGRSCGSAGYPNYDSHKTRNPPPVKGICTWIFHHAEYQS